jgi:molybdopterin/thiamine biosynthesis adenylyltransferase/TusA-related sulfurtransferase
MSGGVAIVGVGGLGCPAALALARLGVMRVGLFDPDLVEPSNLPRQILFREADIGRPKCAVAAERLRELAPGCEVVAQQARLQEGNQSLLEGWSIWLDGTDSLPQKLWLNDVALRQGVTLIHGGAVRLGGQVLAVVPGRGPCLRCLLEGADQVDGAEASCRQAGILGPVVGALGSFMALLAARALRGDDVAGELLSFDAQRGELRQRKFSCRPGCSCARSSHRTDLEADVTGDVCPMTFVRARLALERLPSGGRLGVLLRGSEPLANLPRSFADEGHRVLAIEPREGGRHWLLVERAANAAQKT